jgi:hypothetical protein
MSVPTFMRCGRIAGVNLAPVVVNDHLGGERHALRRLSDD